MKSEFHTPNRTLRLTIPGDLLSTNVDSLRAEILYLIDSETSANAWQFLELDLKAARMVDSAGLNLIVALIRIAEQRSRRIRVLIESPKIHRTFLFTRLDRHVDLVGPTGNP